MSVNRVVFELLTLMLFSAQSCCGVDVRRKALLHEIQSPLNGLVEHYAKCYYRLPEKKEDLVTFILQSGEDYKEWQELAGLLSNEKVLMDSFQDSLFIYNRENNLGCCVYGTPGYWLHHTEKYPEERMDYWSWFRTSAFDCLGNYLFHAEYQSMSEKLSEISGRYSHGCATELVFQDWLTHSSVLKTIPYKLILLCDFDSKEVRLLESMDDSRGVHCRGAGSQIDAGACIRDFIERLQNDPDLWLSFGPEVHRIIFCAQL